MGCERNPNGLAKAMSSLAETFYRPVLKKDSDVKVKAPDDIVNAPDALVDDFDRVFAKEWADLMDLSKKN